MRHFPFPLPGMVLRDAQNGPVFNTVGFPVMHLLTKLGFLNPWQQDLPLHQEGWENTWICIWCVPRKIEWFVLWDLKSLWDYLRQRTLSAGPTVVPRVPSVSVLGSNQLSSVRSWKLLWKYWRQKFRVKKWNKYAVFKVIKVKTWFLKN